MKYLLLTLMSLFILSCSNSREEEDPAYKGEYFLKKFVVLKNGNVYTEKNYEGSCRANTSLNFQTDTKVIYKRYGEDPQQNCTYVTSELFYDYHNNTIYIDLSNDKVQFNGNELIISKTYTMSDSQGTYNMNEYTHYKRN